MMTLRFVFAILLSMATPAVFAQGIPPGETLHARVLVGNSDGVSVDGLLDFFPSAPYSTPVQFAVEYQDVQSFPLDESDPNRDYALSCHAYNRNDGSYELMLLFTAEDVFLDEATFFFSRNEPGNTVAIAIGVSQLGAPGDGVTVNGLKRVLDIRGILVHPPYRGYLQTSPCRPETVDDFVFPLTPDPFDPTDQALDAVVGFTASPEFGTVAEYGYRTIVKLSGLGVVIRYTVDTGCDAEINNDGVLDQGDIQVFIKAFLRQDLVADLNLDNIVDMGDISHFVESFVSGC